MHSYNVKLKTKVTYNEYLQFYAISQVTEGKRTTTRANNIEPWKRLPSGPPDGPTTSHDSLGFAWTLPTYHAFTKAFSQKCKPS